MHKHHRPPPPALQSPTAGRHTDRDIVASSPTNTPPTHRPSSLGDLADVSHLALRLHSSSLGSRRRPTAAAVGLHALPPRPCAGCSRGDGFVRQGDGRCRCSRRAPFLAAAVARSIVVQSAVWRGRARSSGSRRGRRRRASSVFLCPLRLVGGFEVTAAVFR